MQIFKGHSLDSVGIKIYVIMRVSPNNPPVALGKQVQNTTPPAYQARLVQTLLLAKLIELSLNALQCRMHCLTLGVAALTHAQGLAIEIEFYPDLDSALALLQPDDCRDQIMMRRIEVSQTLSNPSEHIRRNLCVVSFDV
jgi:hypothetical protein